MKNKLRPYLNADGDCSLGGKVDECSWRCALCDVSRRYEERERRIAERAIEEATPAVIPETNQEEAKVETAMSEEKELSVKSQLIKLFKSIGVFAGIMLATVFVSCLITIVAYKIAYGVFDTNQAASTFAVFVGILCAALNIYIGVRLGHMLKIWNVEDWG